MSVINARLSAIFSAMLSHPVALVNLKESPHVRRPSQTKVHVPTSFYQPKKKGLVAGYP